MSDDDYRPTYTALPCPCGHKSCKNWLVSPVAAYQGVSFTEKQAKAVAKFLTNFDATKDPARGFDWVLLQLVDGYVETPDDAERVITILHDRIDALQSYVDKHGSDE